jgi:TP901 family phage tail tape measure protein
MASRDEVVKFVYELTGDEKLAKATGEMLDTAAAGKQASAEITKYTDAIKTAGSVAEKASKALSLKAALAETTQQLDAAKKSLAALDAEFSRTDTSSRKVTKAFADTEKAIERLTSQQNKQQVALAKTEGALKKAGEDTSNLAAVLNKAQAQGAAAAQSLAKLGDAATKAGAGTKDAAKGAKDLGDESKKTGSALTLLADNLGKIVTLAAATKLALAGMRLAGNAFEGASQIEDQLARVQAIAQSTQEQFAKFGPAIRDAAQQVNVSSQLAATALAALVQQGQSADEALQSLIPTLQLAKIAQIDVAQAAAIVDDALDRFGLTAADAGSVVDILVVASKGAKDGLAGIAGAMQGIAPIAREMGLSFKDTAAILGLLQQNGIDAGNAVRGLRTIFTDLQDPSSKLRLNLLALGDDTGDFKTAINTLASSGDKGKSALLEMDGAARVLATFLVQQGAGAIDRFTASLDKANGASSKIVKTINDTAGGAFDALTNALDDAASQLAEPFLEPVRNELQKLANELNAFAKTKEFDEIKAELTSLATDAIKALDKLIHGLRWEDLAKDAKGAVKSIGDDFHSLAENVDSVVSGISKFVAVLTILKNVGDIGSDLGKAVFGGTTEAALAASLAVSKARDAITGSVSDTTRALEDLLAKARGIRQGGLAGLKTDADEAAAAVGKLGDEAKNVDLSKVGEQASGAADDLGKIPDAADRAIGPVKQLTAVLQDVGAKGEESVAGLSAAVDRLGAGSLEKLKEAAGTAQTDLDKLWAGFIAGSGNIEDVRAAFIRYGEAQRAAVANSESFVKSQKEVEIATKAAALGLTDVLDSIGSHPIKAPDTAPIRRAFAEVQQASGDAVDQLASDNQRAEELAGSITGAMGNSVSAFAAFISEFAATSANAVKKFSDLTKAFFEGAGDFSFAAQTDATGILKFGEAVEQAGKKVQASIDEQRAGVAALAQQFDDMSDAQLRAATANSGNFDALTRSLEGTAAAAAAGSSAFDLLGAADLAPLQAALDAAAAKVDALRQKAIDAKAEFESIGDSIQDQLDRASGNDAAIENRRFENQLEDLRKLAEETGTLNSQEYLLAVKRAKELHALNLKNIAEEKKAAGAPDKTPPPKPGGGGGGGAGGSGSGVPTQANTVNVSIDGTVMGDPKTIVEFIKKELTRQLNNIVRRGQ